MFTNIATDELSFSFLFPSFFGKIQESRSLPMSYRSLSFSFFFFTKDSYEDLYEHSQLVLFFPLFPSVSFLSFWKNTRVTQSADAPSFSFIFLLSLFFFFFFCWRNIKNHEYSRLVDEQSFSFLFLLFFSGKIQELYGYSQPVSFSFLFFLLFQNCHFLLFLFLFFFFLEKHRTLKYKYSQPANELSFSFLSYFLEKIQIFIVCRFFFSFSLSSDGYDLELERINISRVISPECGNRE